MGQPSEAAAKVAQELKDKGQLESADVAGYQKKDPGKRMIVFTGNSDGSPLSSWCPDCERALLPVLESAASLGLPLLVVGIGERDDWKLDARGSSHPFRAKDGLALTGVPTLLLTGENGGQLARLGSELENEQDIVVMRSTIEAAIRAALA
mmetsp:Transcript_56098/g.162459  ORF Transcript_56098/g.162459 Transcript_56098/m.162459 type:complete len:151 (+) Transcript_56098:71-523(+)